MERRLAAGAIWFGALLCAGGARAQTTSGPPTASNFVRNIDVQAFRPAPGPNNFLTVAGARVDGHMSLSLGAFANYSFRPFTIYDANCPNSDNDNGCTVGAVRSRPIEHLVTLDLLATLTLFRRLQIGLDLPVSFEAGDEVRMADARTTGSQSSGAIGDPRLEAKVRIVGDGLRGPAFAVAAFGQFPVGRFISSDRFLGDQSVILGGRLIGEFRTGRLAFAANLGAFWRPERLQILSSSVGSRLTWGAAGSYDITPRVAGLLEFFGSTDLTNPNFLQQNAIEGDLAVRYRVGDLALTAGGGTGILRGVGAPVARGFLGVAWAPFRADSDQDGVQDDLDRCPTQPEDRDGFEDSDGCPEPDNDGDTLLDAQDRCPDEPEDRDGVEDQDGCPDRDNDHDGVPDGYDTCPNQPEDRDGDRDDDGCPDNDRDRDGVPDERDRCPTQAEDTDGFQDEDGCPDPDNDGDGVLDQADQCGEQPETFNGYQDEDGCPDTVPDRDHDGIADDRDRCPDQPETYNGNQDDDGCPEAGRSLVQIEGEQIRILQQVNFATNSDRIVGVRSFQVLDAVVAVLNAHPELAHLDVQGHTDNAGDAAHNRDLSQRRAESVRTYLTGHGIAQGRLTAHGFGPDRPIESNTTRNGRAHNRRVEFHIVGPAGVDTGTAIVEPAPAAGASAPSATPPAGGATAPTTPAPPPAR